MHLFTPNPWRPSTPSWRLYRPEPAPSGARIALLAFSVGVVLAAVWRVL